MPKTLTHGLIYIIPLVLVILFFSYRLIQSPPGLTVDEAAFGYNGVLLARDGHDENGKFLPFFVLSIHGADWRQPVTQYFLAGFFKLFGASAFNLRFTSVLIVVFSLAAIFYLAKKLVGTKFAVFSSVVFLTAPIMMIQAHMALDNIMPVPFTILWLTFLYLYEKGSQSRYLFWAAVVLGINFYTYKAMRGIVPAWMVVTGLYVLYLNFFDKKKRRYLKSAFMAFGLGLVPFVLLTVYLKNAYPGAIFGGYRPHMISWPEFFYTFLANLDPSFLFVSGDATVYHSTGRHGMFLLASLPLFIVGGFRAVQEKKFWLLIVSLFFLTPAVFGFVGSVHRASRMLAMVPMYALISGLGLYKLTQMKNLLWAKAVPLLVLALMSLNYFDFVNYYWFTYPKFVKSDFSQTSEDSYKIFAREAAKENLTPYVDRDLYQADGEVAHFYGAAYFPKGLTQLAGDQKLLPNGILMTYRENIQDLTRVDIPMPGYFLYVKKTN